MALIRDPIRPDVNDYAGPGWLDRYRADYRRWKEACAANRVRRDDEARAIWEAKHCP